MAEIDFGMLASIDWNSNRWQAAPTAQDLEAANFGFVIENQISYTALNFAHENYPPEAAGCHAGLLPFFWSRNPNPTSMQHMKIAFMRSKNYQVGNKYIVGFYAFPEFERGTRQIAVEGLPNEFHYNLRALRSNIHLLEKFYHLQDADLINFLPGNNLNNHGLNYLNGVNVLNILKALNDQNPEDSRLQAITERVRDSIMETIKKEKARQG